MTKTKLIGTLLIVGTTICYGLVPSFSFLAFGVGVTTETVLFNKFFYAAILMWGFILIKRLPCRLESRQIRMMLAVGAAYIGVATTLYIAFNYISGSLATIISFTYPAMIIAIEMISGKERVIKAKIAAVVISMAGLLLIVWSPDLSINVIGVLFALGTAICYVFYTMGLATERLKDVNSVVVAGYVLLMSAVFNFFRCLFSGNPLFTTGMDQLVIILFLSVVCAFMAILLYCLGVRMIGPGNAAIINTFEPAVACFFGYTLIGDQLTRNMIIGSGLVITAVLIANLPQRKALEQHGDGETDLMAAGKEGIDIEENNNG